MVEIGVKRNMKKPSPDAVYSRHIYIFDDIYISGDTLHACKSVVLNAGAANAKIVGKMESC